MSRSGLLSLRKLGARESPDGRHIAAPRFAQKEEEGSEEGYELTLPTSSPSQSPHPGRALLLSYEEFQSSQRKSLASHTPSHMSSFHGYRPLSPPPPSAPLTSSHIPLEENLVDTPPSPEIATNSMTWECPQCTLLNDLNHTSCLVCSNPRPGYGKTAKIFAPEVDRREVVSEDDPEESSESASGSEWDEEDGEGSEVLDLGSDEASGDEEGAKKSVEDIFLQCLPSGPKSKSRAQNMSHEIVDLTDLEAADRDHSSSATPSRRLIQPTHLVEEIEDFEDEDNENIPSSHPILEHFRTVQDLRRGGYNVIDFSKFILTSTPSNRSKATSHYDARREKRDNDSKKKKRKSNPSNKGPRKRYSKGRSS